MQLGIILTLIHHHEVGVSVLVDFANSTKEKTDTSVLKDGSIKFSIYWIIFEANLYIYEF